MKCQHCGINFDDEERECPICGARAGSRGRLTTKAKPREIARPAAKPKEKTVLNGKPAKKENKIGKNISAVIVAALVLLRLFPTVMESLVGALENAFESVGDVVIAMPEPAPEPDAAPPAAFETPENGVYFVDENGEPYAMLCNLWGENGAAVTLPSGELLRLYADEYEHYTLQAGDFYEESGWGWAMYTEPNEYSALAEVFPPENYVSFMLCLTYEELVWSGAAEDIAYHEEEGDLWLAVVTTHDGSERYLVDIFGDAEFLFGDVLYLPLEPLEVTTT